MRPGDSEFLTLEKANALVQKLKNAHLYVEDFGDDRTVGSGAVNKSAPQWVQDDWHLLQKHWRAMNDFGSTAYSIYRTLDGNIVRGKNYQDLPYGTVRVISKGKQGDWRDGTDNVTEVILDDDEAKRTIAWRREQIRRFRAGEVEAIDWRPPDTDRS